MKKKILAGLLSGAMALSLAACGGGGGGAANTPAGNSSTPSTSGTTPVSGESYTVGICQQMTHEALDAATQGFKDALNEKLPGQVTFEEQDAGGEYANCGTIMDGFVAQGVDLILANATYPLQAAASATADIPILGTSVTDYATALSIEDWTGTVGGNISGTSDLAPLDQQADMLQELFPDATNVGLLYCSGEPNSVYQIETIQGYLEEMGYTCTQYAFTDVNDLSSVVQTACDGSDVIYVPTDNTAAANTETIANVVIPAGVPVIAGESGICSGCGVATLSISYYDIGYKTGEMAAQILTGEADISTMPVEFAPNVTKMYNAANCEALNLTMPEGYEPIA
ncbi:ABC transporter substrate-binding protein [Pseudoflavonifractor phocaeensis]|uniref:ABC transporter substrate-binding protein n=1 Tax=Pseudoflavonifractor phocaeensis TaxID=1870988 RepID=UPI00195CE39A|nr:ABC transporter substrate-binding protein [Pseudoflavonifractor phocaeensis]MBM6925987.1 ABC transporter substrate-binding protein [Pseudoflavonifractor phocaeensis]